MDIDTLGAIVKTTRRRQKLTQGDVASRAGISRGTLDAIENNSGPDVGLRKLLRVLHALGLDVEVRRLERHRPTLDELVDEQKANLND